MSLADVVAKAKRVLGMTEEMIVTRVAELESSVTETVFNYTRRGLFEKDKLTVAAMLCLSILKRRGTLSSAELECLIVSKSHPEPGGMGGLSEWMTEGIWAKVRHFFF